MEANPHTQTAPIAVWNPVAGEDIPVPAKAWYSRMKYGDPKAVRRLAQEMLDAILARPDFVAARADYDALYIASSAYGSIPTAAHSLMLSIADGLRTRGWKVQVVKIDREGGFGYNDYASLDTASRAQVMRQRRIILRPEVAAAITGKWLLVIDDLLFTGAHERSIRDLLAREAPPGRLDFAYWLCFSGMGHDPSEEDRINHSEIRRLDDLVPLYLAAEPPFLNARVLKFILMGGPEGTCDRRHFFETIGPAACKWLYEAALSPDGYFHRRNFREGFRLLETVLLESGNIERRKSVALRNSYERKVVCYNLGIDGQGQYIDHETGGSLHEIVQAYSRFKFGSVPDIAFFGKALAATVIATLENGGSLREVFERAGSKGEHVYLVAPGIRNVVSASNYLLREVARRLNVYLGLRGWPTCIVKPLTRLGSGRANYASLDAAARKGREKSTQTLIPKSDYADFPVHVLFVDDVEVSGATVDRARAQSLAAGALSFHALFALRVDPVVAALQPAIEHALNQHTVTGRLDQPLADILVHPDFQPVQRLLRLILHPKNAADLERFALHQIPDHSLLRIYEAALANDYLRIVPDENGTGLYAPALHCLRNVLEVRQLIDESGQLL